MTKKEINEALIRAFVQGAEWRDYFRARILSDAEYSEFYAMAAAKIGLDNGKLGKEGK